MRFVEAITLVLTDAFFDNSEINPTGTAGRCFSGCFGLPITVFYPASFSTLCFLPTFCSQEGEIGLISQFRILSLFALESLNLGFPFCQRAVKKQQTLTDNQTIDLVSSENIFISYLSTTPLIWGHISNRAWYLVIGISPVPLSWERSRKYHYPCCFSSHTCITTHSRLALLIATNLHSLLVHSDDNRKVFDIPYIQFPKSIRGKFASRNAIGNFFEI